MKKILFLFCLCLSSTGWMQANSNQTLTLLTSENFTVDNFNQVNSQLISNYPDRIFSLTLDPTAHTMLVTTNMAPIDILQLIDIAGFKCIYRDENAVRHELSLDRKLMKPIKE